MRWLPLAAAALMLATPSVEAVTPTQSGKALSQRIDIAGRQRMLSQRIGLASCFVMAGIELDHNRKVALDALELFKTSNAVLRNGDPSLGMPPETDTAVLEHLDAVDQLWTVFEPSNLQLMAGANSGMTSEIVFDLPNEVLAQAHETVLDLVKQSSGNTLTEAEAKTVNVAGRQRMLSQRAAKKFCFAALGIYADRMRPELLETIKVFRTSLDQLMNGTGGLIAPPTPELKAQLETVETHWNAFSPILKKAANGAEVSREEMILASQLAEKVLVEMNKAVGMYSKAL